jgi:HK97 family phage prohead protease
VELVGYVITFGSVSRRRDHEEVVSPRILDRSLREHEPLRLLINHDAQKQVASLEDGTLQLVVDHIGVRAIVSVPEADTPGRREVADALRVGAIRGGSFRFARLHTRWDLDRSIPRVEILDAVVKELSVILAPAVPAYASTWAGALSAAMAARWRAIDSHVWYRPRWPVEVTPDLTITRERPSRRRMMQVDALCNVDPDWSTVQRLREQHPSARIIDFKYRRSVRSLEAVQRRRAAAIHPKEKPMHNVDATPELEHATIGGRREPARRALRAIERAIVGLEAGTPGSTRDITSWKVRMLPEGEAIAVPTPDRTTPARGRLTVAEARRRMARRMGV